MTAFKTSGGKEVVAFLNALPKNLRNNALKAGVVAAAKPIRDKARQNAPKDSGLMAKSIKTGSPRVNQDGTVSVRIRLDGKHSYLGIFHEYGVRPHRITVSDETLAEVNGRLKPLKSGRTRSRAVLTRHANRMEREGSLKIGGNYVGPSVEHPGIAARPFLRPALDTEAKEAVNAMGARIREYMSKKTGFTTALPFQADDEEY